MRNSPGEGRSGRKRRNVTGFPGSDKLGLRIPGGRSQHGGGHAPARFSWLGAVRKSSAHWGYSGLGFWQASAGDGERAKGIGKYRRRDGHELLAG